MAPTGEGRAQAQNQSSGSFWMPLMAGYMMGRLMGGGMGAQQPLFSSKTQPARLTANTRMPAVKLRCSNAGSHHDRTENRYGTETSYHLYRNPRRIW